MSEIQNIGGMSIGGGRRENFFLSLLEYYPNEKRWFLKSLLQVNDEESKDRDEIITRWIDQYKLKKIVVDFPLTPPPCEICQLDCPGVLHCPVSSVVRTRDEIIQLLEYDEQSYQNNPKKYEQDRLKSQDIDYHKDLLAKKSEEHLLSKSFKRKLRKGFVPYWHRPIDFWIWRNYYDQLLEVFNHSYDSFGQVSVMLLARLKYLMRHLPADLVMFESHVQICLLELYRSKVITKSLLLKLFDLEEGPLAREKIILLIEEKLEIFIYEKDLQLIIKNPQAFQSFLLSVAGQSMLLKSIHLVPDWVQKDKENFIFPSFG